MDLFILSSDNSEEMEKIAEELSQNKFKVTEREDHFILMRKKRYGNLIIQAIFLILAFFVSGLFIFANVVYFAYSYLWASPNVLITTEKFAENGEKLEFNSMDEVLKKANATL